MLNTMKPRKATLTPDEFVAALRAYIARHKLSQGDAGKELGFNRVTISRWLSGKQTPDPFKREVLAKILDK